MPHDSNSLEQVRSRVYGQRQHTDFAFQIDREADVDEAARTVNLAFASNKAIDNWYYGAIELQMGKKNVRTQRLDSGAPLLMDHDTRDQVGVIEKYSFDSDGIARCTVRFGESTRAQEVFNDVRTGIRQNVSVGFIIWDLNLKSDKKGEKRTYTVDDWEPYEVSIVAVPADISVGVGRSADMPDENCPTCDQPMAECTCEADTDSNNASRQQRAISQPKETKTMTLEEIAAEEAKNQRAAELLAREAVKTEIRETAAALGKPELEHAFHQKRLLEAIEGEPTVAEFKAFARSQMPATPSVPVAPVAAGTQIELARSLPQHGAVRGFGGDAEKAYRFGQWIAAIAGREGAKDNARKFCVEKGIVRSFAEGVNETGGFLVPEEFGTDLILLREQYGVFRQNAKIVPMSSSDRTDPRQTGGVTAYFANEEAALTESTMAWDQVSLSAKKLVALTRISSELNEDSVISIGDTVANEIAYAFAKKEDECGFVGDGTSTYGGIKGVTNRLKDLSGTIANIAGLQVGSGNAYSELALVDFEGVVGHLPQYADSDRAAWFVHRSFYWNVMVKLALAAGGNTASEIEDARNQRFMGYRVVYTQVMPKAEANSQVCALFGDLSKAASLGTRRDVTIATSEHSRFAYDQIEIKGTQRFDIVVHDIGNASATAASRQEGAIVGLITAAS